MPPVERLRGRAGVTQRARRMERTGWLCELCQREGVVRVATVVDHVVPLALGGQDLDGNTRNLCDEHHAEVTAAQFGQRPPIEGRGVSRSGRPSSPTHPWNRPAGIEHNGGPALDD